MKANFKRADEIISNVVYDGKLTRYFKSEYDFKVFEDAIIRLYNHGKCDGIFETFCKAPADMLKKLNFNVKESEVTWVITVE